MLPSLERIVALASFPFFHEMSTSKPPRAHSPFTLPVGQAFGSAGIRFISPECDCKSISAIPDVPPKLPSIWNGGQVSNMLGSVPVEISSPSILKAWSPSSSRAHRLIFHALLQPVPPSPRVFSDFFTAAASSGVPRNVICSLGNRP